MSLLRRGSSRISEENFENRRHREKAKDGSLCASLAWNDPSDLDLHARVILAKGGQVEICYRNKQQEGGTLDVDMHARDGEEVPEPVENIFWKKPPAGVYSIIVKLYKKRGAREAAVPFRAVLKRDDEDDLSKEGAVGEDAGGREVEVFRFTVDEDGDIVIGRVGSDNFPWKEGAVLRPARRARPARAMKAMKGMKAVMKKPMKKVMKKVMKKKAMKKKPMKKVSTIAKGKKAKVQVWKGKKTKTKKGLKKEDLVKSKSGKIVSAKKSKQGRDSKWAKATAKARAIKGYTGFKAIKRGGSFYEKAKEVMSDM